MEFLTQLFGNLTSGIIRLAVTVGILAAVYFFILRPVLDTTNHAVDSANKAFENPAFNGKSIEEQVNKTVEEVNKQVEQVNEKVGHQVERSFHTTTVHGGSEKLVHCIQRANGNVHRIERCAKKF